MSQSLRVLVSQCLRVSNFRVSVSQNFSVSESKYFRVLISQCLRIFGQKTEFCRSVCSGWTWALIRSSVRAWRVTSAGGSSPLWNAQLRMTKDQIRLLSIQNVSKRSLINEHTRAYNHHLRTELSSCVAKQPIIIKPIAKVIISRGASCPWIARFLYKD